MKEKKKSYGICPLSSLPVRAQSSDSSEMVTQLLFGETFEVIAAQKQWRQIKITYDGYMGWIDEKQILHITEAEHAQLKNSEMACTLELVQMIEGTKGHFPILIGSSLPHWDGKKSQLGTKDFKYKGRVVNAANKRATGEEVANYANKYLGAPYLWGGRSPMGIDCSGLMQVVFKLVGIPLLRDASQQATQGKTVEQLTDAKVGDLAFFSKQDAEKIIHVGIVLDNQRIIHASGEVRIDELHESGIFRKDRQTYTHRLRSIKRML